MRKRDLALVLTTLSILGCSRSLGKPKDAESDQHEVEEQQIVIHDVPVHVRNHNWADVVIYLIRGTTRTRLGQVTSMSDVSFILPNNVVGAGSDLRLLVDPIGSTAYFVTDYLLLSPGVGISLYVENHLPASSWTIMEELEPEPATPADSAKTTPADTARHTLRFTR